MALTLEAASDAPAAGAGGGVANGETTNQSQATAAGGVLVIEPPSASFSGRASSAQALHRLKEEEKKVQLVRLRQSRGVGLIP